MANYAQELNGKTQNLRNDLNKDVREVGTNIEDTVNKFSKTMGKSAGQLVSDVSESVTDYYATGRDYVKENPLKGVAMAAAVGVVAGSILMMAMKKR